MPHPAHPLLLPSATRPTRPAAPHPRQARGGPDCRALTASAMLAEIGEAPLTRAGAGTAHKARGTYPLMTDESIAAFLAAEARA